METTVNLTELAIKKPVFAWMIMASFIFFGLVSFFKLGISETPDVDFPVLNVSVTWEGAAPEVIEMDILDTLESALLGVEGIKTMSSVARRGQGNITLEFDLDKNIDTAVQEVQSILGRTQRVLPDDIDAPVVRKSNPEDKPIMWLSVTSTTLNKKDLMAFVRDQLKDRFQTIEGVSEIILGGFVEPNLRVYLHDQKLKNYSLTATDIINAITNEHAEYPAGIFEDSKDEFNIRVLGEALTEDEFSKLSINQRGGAPNYTPIPLKSVARIEDGLSDQRSMSRVMGDMSIGLGIRKQRGSNAVEVGDAIKRKLEEVKPLLPEGVSLGVNYDGTVFIKDAISELQFTLILSAVMTCLVVWFFLGSFGAAFNIMLSIPTAIIATFMGLKLFGFTLNTFTMMSLTLAVGLVVDDNIMILENIMRYFKELKDKIKASFLGTKEIAFAALAASTAIIAIFLPIGFISGIVGKYFFQFALTICIAIFFSYIDAVTLTPMRSSYLLGQDKKEGKRLIDSWMARLEGFYSKTLAWALKKRFLVLGLSLATLVLTVFIFKALKREFTPAQDQSRLVLMFKTKPGSSLEFTSNKVLEVEKVLMNQGEVLRYFVSIGGWSGNESNSAFAYMTLKDFKDRPVNSKRGKKLTQQEFAQYLREEVRQVKGIMTIVSDPSVGGMGTGSNFPIELTLNGPSFKKLQELYEEVKAMMIDSKLMVEVDSNFKGTVPEINIIPDRQKALERGVSIKEIGKTVQSMVSGIVASKFSKGGRRYDVRVKIEGDDLKEINDLSKIMVRNNRGELIPLSEVTKIEKGEGLLSITRKDRVRAITITSNLAQGISQQEALDYIASNIRPKLPEGYSLLETGSTQTYNESTSSLVYVLVLGLVLAYMILASQFNSFIHPITIFAALPFSFTGAFLALYLTGLTVNIYSMIGLILLMGIVKKNSIILVDFTNEQRLKGHNVLESLKIACPIRLRPIIMTTVSTLAGTLPAALALGPGAESRVPLAVAVIGGLLFSTILTLYVVPCLYTLIPGKIDHDRNNL